jgi:hypothetical protein
MHSHGDRGNEDREADCDDEGLAFQQSGRFAVHKSGNEEGITSITPKSPPADPGRTFCSPYPSYDGLFLLIH